MSRARRLVLARGALVGTLLLAATGVASAHEVSASRFAAPIPLGYLYAGAGVTVLLTAVLSARLVSDERTRTRTTTVLSASTTRALVGTVQALAVVGFAVVLWQGLTGRQVRASNVATLLTWAVAFDGLALLAALVGSPWRVLAPWNALYGLLCRLEGRRIRLVDWEPDRLGRWPALVGFLLLIGVLENLTVVPESPADTAALLAVYATWLLVGLVAVGPAWFEHADPIGVFLRLFSRVAPVRFERDANGRLTVTVRAPWAATARPVTSLGAVAFVVATVYTISFDGFTSTPVFRSLLFWAYRDVGVPVGAAGVALYAVGYALFLAAFGLTAVVVDRLGGGTDVRTAAQGVAPTLLPIAVAYEFAHYGPAVVAGGASLLVVAAAGLGATVQLSPLSGMSVPLWWGFEVVVIVLGHAVGVVAAHDATLARYDDRTAAWRAHAPLVALMIGYTVLSLWIVSEPVVV